MRVVFVPESIVDSIDEAILAAQTEGKTIKHIEVSNEEWEEFIKLKPVYPAFIGALPDLYRYGDVLIRIKG